jgi:hypothetical protein
MKNLATAVIAVMQEVKGIEKNMQIGEGRMSYKGVADQEVKKVIGDAMAKHGLCILPIGVTPITKVDRWEEDDTYNKQPPYPKKTKQSVFTEVATKYLLLHESGESLELAGLGHGVDSQDKGAGKATTYALKYTLLYTFLVPTGKIDDADNTHSDDIQAPKGLSIAEIQKKLDGCKTINELNALFPTITPMTEAIKAMFSARKIQLQ